MDVIPSIRWVIFNGCNTKYMMGDI